MYMWEIDNLMQWRKKEITPVPKLNNDFVEILSVNVFSRALETIKSKHHFCYFKSLHFLQELKQNVNHNIKGLDDFKLAMQTIATIQSTNISTELQLHEIQETFAILADHKIEVMNYRN